MTTLLDVGVPIAVIVIVWSFVTEARLNRQAAEFAEQQEHAERAQAGSYPIPVLTGAPPVDARTVTASTADGTEVLDV
jgi:hypothetical protein